MQPASKSEAAHANYANPTLQGFFHGQKTKFVPKLISVIADWPTSNLCERHSFDARVVKIAHIVAEIENQNVRNFQHPTCSQKLRIIAYIRGYICGSERISRNP